MNKFPRKRTLAAIVLICGILVLGVIAFRFIMHRLAYATTDAVFIRTDSLVNLGFDGVGGRITAMTKNEGEDVARDEILVTLDNRQLQLAVKRLAAQLEQARNELAGLRLKRSRLEQETGLNESIAGFQVTQFQAEKAALEARSASVAASISQLERDRSRYSELVKVKAAAIVKLEDVKTQLEARRQEQKALQEQAAAVAAQENAARKKVELAASSKLLVSEAEQAIAAQTHKIEALTASLEQDRDRLAKSSLKSPLAGRVARRFASPGDVVKEGQAVMALVDPADVFAVALLEENKLKGVAAGAPVKLTLDAYPDLEFRGTVSEVMPASAATFALVPRDISAGEFTKVAQRIPVRITITEGELSLLRVGLGGEVEIKRQ